MFDIILYNFTTNSRKQEYYNKYFSVFGSIGCGREIARACVYTIYIYNIYVHNQCQVCLAAKYRNKTRLDNLAERNVAYNKKKPSYRGGTKQLFCFSYVHPLKNCTY